jgi:hypothetical protein
MSNEEATQKGSTRGGVNVISLAPHLAKRKEAEELLLGRALTNDELLALMTKFTEELSSCQELWVMLYNVQADFIAKHTSKRDIEECTRLTLPLLHMIQTKIHALTK